MTGFWQSTDKQGATRLNFVRQPAPLLQMIRGTTERQAFHIKSRRGAALFRCASFYCQQVRHIHDRRRIEPILRPALRVMVVRGGGNHRVR